MVNSYGNYVVQKALKLSSKNDKISLISNIYKNIQKIKDKRLYLKWKLIVESNLKGTFENFEDKFQDKTKQSKVDCINEVGQSPSLKKSNSLCRR